MTTRRQLLGGFAALATVALPAAVRAASARVVIVGGGFAGASCALALRRIAPALELAVVEPRGTFLTGPFSNAALAGLIGPERIRARPGDGLRRHGIRWFAQAAVALDPVARELRLADGRRLRAERIVVAPGIDFVYEAIDGLSAANSDAVPHAWRIDGQFARLRAQLDALPDGATVLIAAPPNPYRCPPGPYERASLFAWHAQRRGLRRRIVIADAKDDFSKRAAFMASWNALYPGMIEWWPRAQGGAVVAVDVAARRVHLAGGETVHAALLSLIPPQRAAAFARDADLADASGWCPVEPLGFESTRHPGIHVLGDACIAAPMPKSAFAANNQGKACALAIAHRLAGETPPAALLLNTCYSLLAPDYALSISGSYRAVGGRLNELSSGLSPAHADPALRELEARHAEGWQAQLLRDSFG
ncbi:NAD(P)/FAD-dependent oxidoreductase [Solimonas flava]|uniref:NAD(P)/FAD-dependent oxidoreductase n=1 Tax=Solimonas flava TaxID=415849 RepID=UPI000425381F|nr:NAD(P)/FAD-dependent oxidoreductase [Solimonas flava]